MSTRAMYQFIGDGECHTVYKHSDGYPTGAFEAISNALPFAWQLPRFEADEFAAAFIAGNKQPIWMRYALAEYDAKNQSERAAARENVIRTRTYQSGGGVRLVPRYDVLAWTYAADIEYRYEIRFEAKLGIHVTAYDVACRDWDKNASASDWDQTRLFVGSLAAFGKWTAADERKREKAQLAARDGTIRSSVRGGA